ncbi:MAG: hypothetical protein WC686_01345 [Candidatus Shapirobacteria bacterium]|jgi:hypothetical protein
MNKNGTLISTQQEILFDKKVIRTYPHQNFAYKVFSTTSSVWALLKNTSDNLLVLRAAFTPVGRLAVKESKILPHGLNLSAESAIGHFDIELRFDPKLPLVHAKTFLTPCLKYKITDWPKNLFPLGKNYDLFKATGSVTDKRLEARSGMLYAHLKRPHPASFLYLENFPSLAKFYKRTHTSPQESVGDTWPQLGYSPPSNSKHALSRSRKYPLYDSYLALTYEVPSDSVQSRHLFSQLLGQIQKSPEFSHLN